MDLHNLIKGSYGAEDGFFGLHHLARERALESLKVANEDSIGFEEFIERHRDYLVSKDYSIEHIEKQLKKVKVIESYFFKD